MKNLTLENRLSTLALSVSHELAFSPEAQGTKSYSGRIEAISYNLEFTHCLGNFYLTGTVGHRKVVIHAPRNHNVQAWLMDHDVQVNIDGPNNKPDFEANPHSVELITRLFDRVFNSVGRHDHHIRLAKKGEVKGMAIFKEVDYHFLASKLAYLFASHRILGDSLDLLEKAGWLPKDEHISDSGDLAIERGDDLVVSISRANTGTVLVRVWDKAESVKDPKKEWKIVCGPFDQVFGDHASLNQYIVEAMKFADELKVDKVKDAAH